MFGKLKNLLSGAADKIAEELTLPEPTELAKMMADNPELIDRVGKHGDRRTLGGLIHQVKDNPLMADPELWRRFIPYAVKYGHYRSAKPPLPKAEVYALLRPDFLKIGDTRFACEIGGEIVHPEIDPADLRIIVDHCIKLQRRHGDAQAYAWGRLFWPITDKAWLRELMASDLTDIRTAALGRFGKLLGEQPWEELYDEVRADPKAFLRMAPRQVDVGLWRILAQSDEPGCKFWSVQQLINYFKYSHRANPECATDTIIWFGELVETDWDYLLEQLHGTIYAHYGSFHGAGARLLWEQHWPQIDPLIPGLLAREGSELDEAARTLALEVIAELPDSLTSVAKGKLPSLISLFDQELLTTNSATVLSIVADGTNQSLQQALVDVFGRADSNLLDKLGWLKSKAKSARLTCLEILLNHPDPGAHVHLRALATAKTTEQIHRDRILDHLEANGHDVGELDELGNDAIGFAESQAVKTTRVSKLVEQTHSDALAKTLPSLSSAAVRWLLQQMATNKEALLPRSVRKVLAACPEPERISFAEMLLNHWIGKDGDPKMAWTLQTLSVAGTDRHVGPLRDAVTAWHKKRKVRAIRAVQALGQIGTTFSLSQLKAVAETRRNTSGLIEAARQSLQAAADQKGVSLAALYDELVPDFGLTDPEGLALDVGPYAYRVKLQGDLSLRVIGPTGKMTKTMPKAKPDEEPALRAAAETRFKQLRKDLKQLADQQTQRLPALLMGVRSWTVPAWRKVFVDHPVFRTLAQSLIWSRRDSEGQVASFRLAEDLGLINPEDDPIELSDSDQVTLWHPIDQTEATAVAWRQHLKDYDLSPILEQTDLPVHRWSDEWLKTEPAVLLKDGQRQKIETEVFAPFQGHVVTMGHLKRLMARWGYRVGPTEGRGNIYEHYLPLDDVQLRVQLNHSGMPAWFDESAEIAIRSIDITELKGRGLKTPKDLPPAMLSILYAQLQELAGTGEGYREDWEKL